MSGKTLGNDQQQKPGHLLDLQKFMDKYDEYPIRMTKKQDGWAVRLEVTRDKILLYSTSSGSLLCITEELERQWRNDLHGLTGIFFCEWTCKTPSTSEYYAFTQLNKDNFWFRYDSAEPKNPITKAQFDNGNYVLVIYGKDTGTFCDDEVRMRSVHDAVESVRDDNGAVSYPANTTILACHVYANVTTANDVKQLFEDRTRRAMEPGVDLNEGFVVNIGIDHWLRCGPGPWGYRSKYQLKLKNTLFINADVDRENYNIADHCARVKCNPLDAKSVKSIPVDEDTHWFIRSKIDKHESVKVNGLLINWHIGITDPRHFWIRYCHGMKPRGEKRQIDEGECKGTSSKKACVTSSEKESQRTWEELPPKARPEWVALTEDKQNALMTAVNKGIMPGYESWDVWTIDYIKASPKLRAKLWKMLIERCEV